MKMRTVSRWLLRGLVALVLVYFGAALAMSAWPAPGFSAPAVYSPEAAKAQGLSLEQVYPFEERRFTTRDGETLYARHFAAEAPALTLLIVHGMTGESSQFNVTAGLLREATGAEVYALDLRGHGESGGRAGDIDHIGQYEEDLVDVIASLKRAHPDRPLVMAGHSMGGGIAQRYAQLSDSPAVDGYLLYAPLLGGGAPTARAEFTEESGADEPWLKLAVPRIIGLSMLSAVGVTGLNALPTAVCHVTEGARVGEYSFRALVSTAPLTHAAGLRALDAPVLVLVGSEDEAFVADAYPSVVEAHARVPARVNVVDGANHNGVHHDPRSVAAAADWLSGLGLTTRAGAGITAD
jgi:alpha-beta hydrolase superfamily lysophospholipase